MGTAMIAMLLLTLGVSIGSAILPVMSVELFIVATVTAEGTDAPSWWAIGLVVAAGQIAGKLLYFYGARGDLRLPHFLHRKTQQAATPQEPEPVPHREHRSLVGHRWRLLVRWCAVQLAWLREKCHAHPKWMFGTHAVSSVVGLPPFMITTVLAGLSGMSLATFLVASVPGRFIRFSVLALSPALVLHVPL